MKYNRAQLRATALDVKAAHEKAIKDSHAKHVADYQKSLKQWQEKGKPEAERVLKEALAAVRKDQSVGSLYRLSDKIANPPSDPGELDCCSVRTKELDGLVELLDTLADDDITATQLNLAGFKNVSQLLRRPC